MNLSESLKSYLENTTKEQFILDIIQQKKHLMLDEKERNYVEIQYEKITKQPVPHDELSSFPIEDRNHILSWIRNANPGESIKVYFTDLNEIQKREFKNWYIYYGFDVFHHEDHWELYGD